MEIIFDDITSLVAACKKKDPAAQKCLFDQYQRKVMTLCLRYLKDKEKALELMNEIFMKIFSKIHLYKEEINFEGWMMRVAANTVIDYVRKDKQYRQQFITTDDFSFYGYPDESEEGDISEWWERALEIPSAVLFEMIYNLPPATRIVFNLYVIEGFSHKEITRRMGISEGTSKWHLSNARKLLKEKIRQLLKDKKYGSKQENR